ncbi:anthocyanidin reductase ((2S)-flavan-3-ol-forming)-like [Salvia miltiorrhiza]|uniref:anthocyanidin reductase ((2S)-flavan-3-ol-forming)-like n=1 Tax=Salvia miltiorrhiza TaxID=226208 RepID=UPI0025ABF420|nr:anthocyanidin reductase ((2S)-flavan-3-ol-forming)-like [Salvia miltiorrhiza]
MEKVFVTGGVGYLASFLIKHLLERGYIVHATLRDLSNASKVGLLKGLAHAKTRLKLFEADIYNPSDFAAAIRGCAFVFHLATPLHHYDNNPQYKDTTEAAVAGVKIIAESCIKSKTVKKLIYTASVMAASPLIGDASGYKDVVDETCWTPLDLPYKMYFDYIHSKTLAEKEVLSYNGLGIEVVSLACGLVGGETIQSFVSDSMALLISQALSDGILYKGLRSLEDLDSKVPIAHVQDVIDAHIFAMENSNMNGRFLVASDFLKSVEIAYLIKKQYPYITILPKLVEDTKRETKWGSTKLEQLGFHYKFGAAQIIYDSIACAKRLGVI